MSKDQLLAQLSAERAKLMQALDDNLLSDEDHFWRAQQYLALYNVEMEIHRLQS